MKNLRKAMKSLEFSKKKSLKFLEFFLDFIFKSFCLKNKNSYLHSSNHIFKILIAQVLKVLITERFSVFFEIGGQIAWT